MIINLFNKYKIHIDFYFNINAVEKRQGVCSINHENNNHMLLCDFDNTDIDKITNTLQLIQIKYKLPDIYILESSKNHYHAYCFCSRNFKEIIHILSDMKYIDIEYLRLGMARGYYTLRYSPKNNKNIELKKVLKSIIKPEMSPLDVTINEYLTTNK